MKASILMAVLLASSMFAPGSLAEDGNLRKCSFYEIMNDEDEDGLVQGPSGESICYYLSSDMSSPAPNASNDPGTTPTQDITTDGDEAKAPMQKARHDAMQASPDKSDSKVEVRGWDPEKKEAIKKDATRKVKIPALDGSSKEGSE